MYRRTKIVATLGPATDKKNTLENIIKHGVNLVRLNFSHGKAQDHIKRAKHTRKIANEYKLQVGILADLQGIKIRISTFRKSKITLQVGANFTLDADMKLGEGDEQSVGVDYKNLPQDLKSNDILLLNDGLIQLKVLEIDKNKINTIVIIGGELSNNKGSNRLGGGLSASAFTDKDKQDLKTAAMIGVDYIAVSFPRNGDDIR